MVIYEFQHKSISGPSWYLKRSTYYYILNKLDKDTKNDDIMNTIIDIYLLIKHVMNETVKNILLDKVID